MIKGSSLETDLPNIEHMFIVGEVVGGSGEILSCTLRREDLDVAQQTTYDEALVIVSSKCFTEIENTVSELSIDRITSSSLGVGTDVLDFNTMTEGDKDKLRALLALIVELKG